MGQAGLKLILLPQLLECHHILLGGVSFCVGTTRLCWDSDVLCCLTNGLIVLLGFFVYCAVFSISSYWEARRSHILAYLPLSCTPCSLWFSHSLSPACLCYVLFCRWKSEMSQWPENTIWLWILVSAQEGAILWVRSIAITVWPLKQPFGCSETISACVWFLCFVPEVCGLWLSLNFAQEWAVTKGGKASHFILL